MSAFMHPSERVKGRALASTQPQHDTRANIAMLAATAVPVISQTTPVDPKANQQVEIAQSSRNTPQKQANQPINAAEQSVTLPQTTISSKVLQQESHDQQAKASMTSNSAASEAESSSQRLHEFVRWRISLLLEDILENQNFRL
jgi:hypothetical protein